ncbi:MAG: HAMP domain-containing histidine kinase [Bacteroidaceae bacterium]|nr:HAMP domain-containing histidine kinase [Bacteroidaceae bacterium]
MRKHHLSLILPILIVLLAFLTGSCSKVREFRSQGPRHSIVVIHSWDSIGEEKELFSKYMEEAFQEHHMNVDIHHIYLGMVRRPADILLRYDWEKYAAQIKALKPEVILLNDDPIVEWVLTHAEGDSVFMNTPTVFAGVNTLLRDSLQKFPLMTGFESRIDLGRNIEMVMKIAKTQNVTIELDNSDIENRLRHQFREELADSTRFINNEDFHLRYVDDDDIVKNYPGLAVVNFVSCASPYLNRGENESDSLGKSITGYFYHKARSMWHLQVKRDIYSNSIIDHTGRPQFTAIREQFNNPHNVLFLAGYFTSTETQVKDQVNYAVRIIRGERPKSLSISVHSSEYYMDWNAMQQMTPKMSYSAYSNRFTIVNAPFYLEEPLQFAIEVGVIVLLIGIVIYVIVYFMLQWKWKGQMNLVEELQYEEKVHDLMFSSAKDTIWVLKDDVITLTPQFANYFKLPTDHLTLEEMEGIVHEDTKASFEFLKNFRNQRGRKTVRLHLSPDGGKKWYWAEAMYTATDESAKTGELYGLLLNIDQKKETEEKLEQAQILASQVALKENFLANISHDLRTPLGAVTGFSTMLTTPGMTFEEGEREMYGEVIHQNTDMILNMIDSVMEKAQIETGDLEIIQKPVSIQKLIDECYKTNYIIAPTHLKFILETVEPDATVNIDMTRTKQVINNFLSNAFKFTTEGSVTLGWKYMEDNQDMLEVYVKDTGIGVEPEKQAMLFERYKKVNETDKGTGLGLNISKTIMEKQGGTIGVESEFGHGSKFFFRLTRMVECLLLMVTLGIGLLLPSSCVSRNKVQEEKAKVLVYYSYEKDYPAYQGLNDKILQTFRNNGINADIQYVYLDLENPSRTTDKIHHEKRKEMEKIGWKPDVIITEGDRAAHDYIQWREKGNFLDLDSVPVVFGGLHHPEWEYIRKHNNIVVINDPIDYCANINLAVELSGKNCVEIELDFFHQDSLIRNELRQAISRPPYIDNSDFHVEITADEQFSTIWKDSVMVLVYSTESPERNSHDMYERDEGYRNLERIYVHSWLYPSLAVKRDLYSSSIADKTGKPQFTAVKAGFAEGDGKYLCGYFANYETVAEDVAHVAAEILKGADLASFVGMTHQKKYYMDYNAMEKLGLEYKDYKDRFVIVDAPIEKISPFYRYVTFFIIFIIFITAIGAIILVLQSWKSRTAQGLVESVTRRAEMRQMALHGADSHMVRTEAGLKDIISHVHPDYSSEIPLIMQSIDIVGTHSHEIYADVDKAGNYRWWQLRFVVIYDNKTGDKHVDGILINIDETKRYEEDLRKAMLLAEEAKQKEDFLTTISHEIRTPLNAVVGFSDVIVSMPPDAFTSEELAEYAKIIKANNTSLSAMIEDILMFSRIESGRIQYVKNEFDAVELIRELVHDWEDLIPEGVELYTVAFQKGIVINNDRTRVKYILSQLVSNAVKFTKKGFIAIGMECHLNDDKVEFFVSDTGCGIPKEKQRLAFGLFWKDDGFVPGLGLGLHVAQKLADGMGLVLDVTSKPECGSRFSLYADALLQPVLSDKEPDSSQQQVS